MGERMKRNAVAVAAVIILSACASAPTASVGPAPSSTAASPSATATPTATQTPTATPTPQAVATVGETASASAGANATPSATSSAATSLCMNTRGGDTGVAGLGAVKGTVPSGRILIGIEAASGPSGTMALAWLE